MKPKKYYLRFRYIPPCDYNTPLIHIPLEETCVKANTTEEAWEKFMSNLSVNTRKHIVKVSAELLSLTKHV